MKQNGGVDFRGGLGPILVDGAEAAQAQCIALSRTSQGEWAFNKDFGIPFDDALLGRFFSDATTSQLLAAEYSDLSAVATVAADAVTFAEDPESRKLTYTIDPVFPIGDDDFAFQAEG